MHITIFAAGSRGDIQPCALLGRELQRAGYDVLLAAPENFAAFAQDHGLPFHPLGGDVQQIMAGETGREFMESGGANPIKSIRAMRTMLGPVALRMAEDALEACHDADALVALAVFAPFAKTITEIYGIPLINLEPTPLLPTRAFPAPGWPVQRDLGGLHNRLSGLAMLRVIWLWYRPFVNEFRRRYGLHPYSGGAFYRILTSTPLLGAYSPTVIPHPPDWPASVHITGYWFPDPPDEWRPPPNLQAFLDAGSPPVYVGFGSMGGREPERFADLVLKALAQSRQRGLLLTGWGGMRALSSHKNVFVLDSAPHSWLFPRMAALVHHGGAGTTAEGLRAGVPAVIVPFIVDQPFWGRRVKALGVGPDPIPHKKLTADNLAAAIQLAVTDESIRRRAAALGTTLRAEVGLTEAVEIIKKVLGD
jgi:sterol 3beta-glucosyltransferase